MRAPRSTLKAALLLYLGVVMTTNGATPSAQTSPSSPAAGKLTFDSDYIAAAQAKLGATFVNFKFDEVRKSEIPGIVEIYAGPRIVYYAPDQDILILGEFYASNGTSITEQKVAQFAVAKSADLDKSAALVVGDSGTEIIAFVDPDCRYCKLAHEWMSKQKPGTAKQYIYFMPLNGRPQAQARATQALCASPEQRAEALKRVFEGSAEASASVTQQCKEAAEAQLATHAQFATKIGVYATPFFIVKGQVVAGFDRERLTTLLAQKNHIGE